MSKRKFCIYNKDSFNPSNGSVTIYSPALTLFSYGTTQQERDYAGDFDNKVLTNTSGWADTNTSIEINTEPLLLSSGSAIISKRLAEREVTLEYSSHVDNPRDAMMSETNIKSYAAAMEPLVITEEIYNSDYDQWDIDALFQCYITTFEPKFDNAHDYSVKLVFKVLKPEKKSFYKYGNDYNGFDRTYGPKL